MYRCVEKEIISLAAKTLGVSYKDAEKYNKPVPQINGWHFWNPVRGGLSVLINRNGEKLVTSSPLNFDKRVEMFLSGKRN